MVLQRRYSVTGQTPPDDVGVVKSPKLQALDTSVQSTTCGLCESGADAGTFSRPMPMADVNGLAVGAGASGHDLAHTTTARSSSKRSATQLPSPSTPSSQGLPTKIARLGLEHDDSDLAFSDDDEGSFSDPLPDSDWPLAASIVSSATSVPSSPACDHAILLDEGIEEAALDDGSQLDSDDFALSPLPFDGPLPLTFCTLPPEIRHQIYLHLPDLVLHYPLIYCLSTFANKKQHPLASVSRQIRSEALAIFYSYNHWIIKLEFKMMYDAFQDWIIRLGEGAAHLRQVTVAVRGSLFKPRTSHSSSTPNGLVVGMMAPGAPAPIEEYHPPDGDASFKIDLSEKYLGGKVDIVRNDGTKEAGEKATICLSKLVEELWEKRRVGTLNGQDWVNMVDKFLDFTGWP
ncbi:hypothetical protein BDV96DRAFT_483750 [Lophiotrema nucula]|uniref:F-box domain-containing protein n=1 Tax=Lophiotrema nucula TaxID=690887 RepID=A0A6A5ZPS7_9PLEO|nr:hypothetical protein BDV96DRAFT_483750 [Lophiotrema nucula]